MLALNFDLGQIIEPSSNQNEHDKAVPSRLETKRMTNRLLNLSRVLWSAWVKGFLTCLQLMILKFEAWSLNWSQIKTMRSAPALILTIRLETALFSLQTKMIGLCRGSRRGYGV